MNEYKTSPWVVVCNLGTDEEQVVVDEQTYAAACRVMRDLRDAWAHEPAYTFDVMRRRRDGSLTTEF